MSKSFELARDAYNNKFNDIKERNFYLILSALVRRDNPADDTLDKLYTYKRLLVSIIENDHRWKQVNNTFINRSNFKYNPVEREITFKTNIIKKDSSGYYVDETSTERAKAHFDKYTEYFIHLSKVERLINNIYLRYKDEVDKAMSLTKDKKTIREIDPVIRLFTKLEVSEPANLKNRNGAIGREIEQTNNFIHTYQKDGLKRLIKWLNTLNGPDNLDTIYDAYIEDMAPFCFIPEGIDTRDPHKMAIVQYLHRLLKMIKKYSVRGDALFAKYELEEEKRKNSSPSNNL